MRPIINIAKLTVLFILRSYVFLSLAVILILCIIFIPPLLAGDGTPASHVTLMIQYTLSIVTFILVFSIIWLSCSIMTYDLNYYQIHLVAVKPVHKFTIWIGKFLGIFFMHGLLLLAAFTLFYFILIRDVNSPLYPKHQKQLIKEEILTGKQPVYCDTSQIKKIFLDRVEKAKQKAKSKGAPLTSTAKKELLYKIYSQTLAQEGQVEPQKSKEFAFHNLEKCDSANISLKYKIYVGSIKMIARQNKPKIPGYWEIKNPTESKYIIIPETRQNIISNIFNQIKLPKNCIDKSGNIVLKFTNLSKTDSVFFQLNESPYLLVKKTNFLNNYLRSFFVSLLFLFFITGLACALGGIFSYPIAIFSVLAYIIIGATSQFILSDKNQTWNQNFYKKALGIIVPIQKFETAEKLSEGKLISVNFIWRLLFELILIRELPLIFVCICIYSKRELGLIIKK